MCHIIEDRRSRVSTLDLGQYFVTSLGLHAVLCARDLKSVERLSASPNVSALQLPSHSMASRLAAKTSAVGTQTAMSSVILARF